MTIYLLFCYRLITTDFNCSPITTVIASSRDKEKLEALETKYQKYYAQSEFWIEKQEMI